MFTSDIFMIVREAVTDDAQGIAEVHVASKKAALRGVAPDAALDRLSVGERIEKWRAIIGDRRYETLVGEDSNRVLGVITFGPTRDQDCGSEKVGEILTLYVHPDAWRRGLGSELVVHALSRLKSASFALVTLWTLESSSQARTFYESCGFSFDGTVKPGTVPGDVVVNDVRYRMRL